MKLIVCGDTHAEWGKVNTLINKEHPDVLVVCGDFGIFPGHEFASLDKLKTQGTKVYFCAGNHENWDYLDSLTDNEVAPGVFYQKSGSVLDLPFIGKTLFAGGAASIDKDLRTPGYDWFPQEVMTAKHMDLFLDVEVDTVVAHTVPLEFMKFVLGPHASMMNDPTQNVLSYVLNKYKPKLFFSGHWHTFKSGLHDQTRTKWYVLDHVTSQSTFWLKFKD